MGKSRLSPLKPMTITRMELSAPVLSTSLDRMIRQEVELPINDSFYWTDNTCVLRYIANSERRYKTFVANQVAAIHEQSIPGQCHNAGKKMNPADDASRGLSAEAIIGGNRRTKGPDFLWLSKENWPQMPATIDEEIKQESLEEVAAAFANSDLSSRLRCCRSFQAIFIVVLVEEVRGADTSVQKSAAKCCHQKKERGAAAVPQ